MSSTHGFPAAGELLSNELLLTRRLSSGVPELHGIGHQETKKPAEKTRQAKGFKTNLLRR
jgi:hypothetical protein